MSKIELEDQTIEQLKAKEKGYKMFIGVFIPLILGLFYFPVRDYLEGNELDWAMITIAICTLGGPATIYPELSEVQKELKRRK